MRPKSNRITNSTRIATTPLSPSTIRTMSGARPLGGMKSMTRTDPASDSNTVSRISVSLRYRRVTFIGRAGATIHRPCSGPPKSAAKQAPESNRGKQHQSIEPSRLTNAAVCRSPISAYSSIRATTATLSGSRSVPQPRHTPTGAARDRAHLLATRLERHGSRAGRCTTAGTVSQAGRGH
jgi:hypothetical protein